MGVNVLAGLTHNLLVLTNKEELIANGKVGLAAVTVRARGSASCDEGAGQNYKITVLDCRRSVFGHFKTCLKKAHGKRLCRKQGPKRLVDIQG